MKARILTIGDELLVGQVVNTNAAWLGERLTLRGVDVTGMLTVGDDVEHIQTALGAAFAEADLVVATGGLGPTHDDVTREAVAQFFGAALRFDEAVFSAVRQRFESRGRHMPESNRSQAYVPDGFEVLPNASGTAPGLWFVDSSDGRTRVLAVLPGVPHEMRRLLETEVRPRLERLDGLRIIAQRTLLTAGIGESTLQERIGDLSDWLGPTLRLAYLPGTSGVRLRMTALGEDRSDVEGRLAAFETRLRECIEAYVYGTDDDTLESVVGGMLRARGATIALAESCTGGHVANRLTDVSGSSDYVEGAVVAYSNAVKVRQLGVDPDVLAREGAVSDEVARQMARGVRERLGTDIGVSTTGVAGPTGGTPAKPVGTVWVGYADAAGETAVPFRFVDDRILNKELTATAVLELVRRRLAGR